MFLADMDSLCNCTPSKGAMCDSLIKHSLCQSSDVLDKVQ